MFFWVHDYFTLCSHMSYNTLKVLFEVHLWTRFDMVENSCASVHGRLTQELGLQFSVEGRRKNWGLMVTSRWSALYLHSNGGLGGRTTLGPCTCDNIQYSTFTRHTLGDVLPHLGMIVLLTRLVGVTIRYRSPHVIPTSISFNLQLDLRSW